MKRRNLAIAALALLALDLSSSASAAPIIVGSKSDRETQILSQMIVMTLRAADMDVVDKTKYGDTAANRKAILAGNIDMYVEYTGNAVFFFPSAKIKPKEARSAESISQELHLSRAQELHLA